MATVFSVCSLLMAFLFAVSASFQLNDPVALEGLENGGVSGLWSLDMRKRVVREKIGSGLVTAAMNAHRMKPFSRRHQPTGQEAKLATLAQKGMLLTLVAVGYGLSVLFYFYHHQEMKF